MINRVNKGEPYWYITSNCTGHVWKAETAYEYNHDLDDIRYRQGNYFASIDEAEAYRKKISDLLWDRAQPNPKVRTYDPKRGGIVEKEF